MPRIKLLVLAVMAAATLALPAASRASKAGGDKRASKAGGDKGTLRQPRRVSVRKLLKSPAWFPGGRVTVWEQGDGTSGKAWVDHGDGTTTTVRFGHTDGQPILVEGARVDEVTTAPVVHLMQDAEADPRIVNDPATLDVLVTETDGGGLLLRLLGARGPAEDGGLRRLHVSAAYENHRLGPLTVR